MISETSLADLRDDLRGPLAEAVYWFVRENAGDASEEELDEAILQAVKDMILDQRKQAVAA